jgi:FkbM family methyltransferase
MAHPLNATSHREQGRRRSSSAAGVPSLLRRLVFQPWLKTRHLQPLWTRLHTLALFGMNYGGGGDPHTSGEKWVLANVVASIDLGSERIIFDVGANTGEYSLMAARLVPRARVFAFEPISDVYESLRARLQQSGALGSAIQPFRLGLSDNAGVHKINIYAFANGPAPQLASLEKRQPTADVEIRQVATEPATFTTLDTFIAERGIDRITLLKVDVEGHELAVLRGAQRTLVRDCIAILQFEVGPITLAAGHSFWEFWELLSPRYQLYRILPDGLAPIDRYREQGEVFLTTNYLAVRRQQVRT